MTRQRFCEEQAKECAMCGAPLTGKNRGRKYCCRFCCLLAVERGHIEEVCEWCGEKYLDSSGDEMVENGVKLTQAQMDRMNLITIVYEQQRIIRETHTHRIPEEIVSLFQPWIGRIAAHLKTTAFCTIGAALILMNLTKRLPNTVIKSSCGWISVKTAVFVKLSRCALDKPHHMCYNDV